MGWQYDDHVEDAGHEGYLVGFVARECYTCGRSRAEHPANGDARCSHFSGTDSSLREIDYDPDAHGARVVGLPPLGAVVDVDAVAAECSCGWRSPRWRPLVDAHWRPATVIAAQGDEDRGFDLWREQHMHRDRQGARLAAPSTSRPRERTGGAS